jgi:GNAT superfamily N-acetyltransferase
MSLWSRYVEERLGWKTIEVEGGFVTYAIKPPDATIEELYVAPEYRGTPLAKRLVDQVVREIKDHSVSSLWSKIYIKSKGAEEALSLNLKYGFKLAALHGDDILLKYKVEE